MDEPDRRNHETTLHGMIRNAADESPPGHVERSFSKFAAMTGSTRPAAQQHLIFQLGQLHMVDDGTGEAKWIERLHGAIDLLTGLAPAGEMEGMLAVQMVAVHEAALRCLNRALAGDAGEPFRGRDLNQASRLCGLYLRQVAALDRRRGRNQQKVRVEHVHVEAGGQAVVGHVENRMERPAAGRAGEDVR